MHSLIAEDRSDDALADAGMPVSPEDQARADFYALIARLLIAPPDAGLLAALAGADSLASQQADDAFDLAWEKLVAAAGVMDRYAVEAEFNQLFISIGTPKINPYASLYLAGFLNEKPLAALRAELAQLGLARAAGVGETEDHLAALCEIMRLLITGGPFGPPASLQRQKLFFEKNIVPWASRCLADIRNDADANFYRQVAGFADAFLAIEAQAFEMEEA